MGRCGWYCYWSQALASSGCGFANMSFPDSIYIYIYIYMLENMVIWHLSTLQIGHWIGKQN